MAYRFNPFTGNLDDIGTSAAPLDATYVTLSTNPTLTNERVLTGTSGQITLTDAGAGSTVTLALADPVTNLNVSDSTFFVVDSANATKKVNFNVFSFDDNTIYELRFSCGGPGTRILNFPTGGATNQTVLSDSNNISVYNKQFEAGSFEIFSTIANYSYLTFDILDNVSSPKTIFDINSTADRTITFQDASGTVAFVGSVAPTNATYVTLTTNATLTNERVLTGTANQVIINDNGAGSTVVLSTPQNIHTGASPTFTGLTLSGLSTGVVINSSGVFASEVTLAVARGGTNLASYTTGDLLYATGTTTLSKLAIGTSGTIFQSNGSAPSWVALSTIDHGSLGGLSDDDHLQYALLVGRAGGQTLNGGTSSSDILTLQANSTALPRSALITTDMFNIMPTGTYNTGFTNVDPPCAMKCTNTITLSFGSSTFRVIDFRPTAVFTVSSAIGMGLLMRNGVTYKNDSTKTLTLGTAFGYTDQSTITADTTTLTVSGGHASFYSSPVLSVTNSGVLNAANSYQFYGQYTVNTGVTLTNRYGVRIEDAGGSGTLTNQYGVLIANLTKGGTINSAITTGTGSIDFGDKIKTYNAIATVSNGVPSILGTQDLTGQTAAKAATTIYTPVATGLFRVSIYLQVTTAASTSSVLGGATGVVITYNDGDGNVAQSNTAALSTTAGAIAITSATNTTATNLEGTMVIYARTGVAIQYAIGYTSVGITAMQYAAHLKVEAM